MFHCALSQQRGPAAALRYVRERDRLLGASSRALGEEEGSGIGEALKKNRGERIQVDGGAGKGEDADGEWEDEDEDEDADKEKSKGKTEQKVYVLDRGFVGWQERFGEDSRLTEGYRKEIWKEGYWM